ncbi:hypothetical protein AB6E22_18055 [Vibrio cyclitrophicus]|uniref:hypothetical protein n=1 Tax=Vibrio TaxID=662 RepID=UPI0007EEBFDD|nr:MULTISPECIES: hypothetical protein [Vibrio]MBE8604500.1 hypothetical protein [Vibrio sp. OPT10]OBT20358.1 hypothetical protein A9263_14905 [Vibrio cyclitrophicus]PME21510.1 hypothetical protein BCV44_00745 [Vibrio cyclitrophicus]PMH22711.1 hypothetical protein BCU73_11535 [Vibrio cyclitrophicus]
MKNSKRFTWIVTLFIASFQSLSNDERYEVISVHEEFSENVNVAGGLLIGYEVTGELSAPAINELYVSRPPNVNKLNVDISTIDGIYSATVSLKFQNGEPFWNQITFPSKYREKLSKYAVEQLTAFAYIEQQDKRGRKFLHVFPISWGMPINSSTKTGYFYINSASNIPMYKPIVEGGTNSYCVDVDSEIKISYNFKCKLGEIIPSGNSNVVFKSSRNKKYLIWVPE